MRTKSVMAHNIVGALMNKTAKSKRKQVVGKGRPDGQDIDLADIPEVTDWSEAVVGKFHRPVEKSVPARSPKSRK